MPVKLDPIRADQPDRGAVAIIVAIFMIVFMIFLAFVIDQGRIMLQRNQLQNAVDAAALAGILEACYPGGDPEGVAEKYGQENGAPDAAAVSQTGLVTYLNVRASTELPLFFGGVFGQNAAEVAAQATTMRECTADFKIVSDTYSQLNGTASTGDGIYAAQCFDGGGGHFQLVAVGVAKSFDCKAVYNGWPNNVPPIYAGTGGIVETPIYNVSGVSVATVAQKAGLNDDATNPVSIKAGEAAAVVSSSTYPDVVGVCKNVTKAAISASQSVDCTGTDKLDLPGGTFSGYLIAEKLIVLDNNTNYTGLLIYSRSGDIDLKGDIGPTTIVYAPNGTVTISGASTEISGRIFAKSLQFNGGKQGAGSTTELPAPGPYSLIQ